MTSDVGTFPFGEPVRVLRQQDRSPKKVFVLGVYASAVHAKWFGPNKKRVVEALAVASEPYIFWRGEDADAIVSRVMIPRELALQRKVLDSLDSSGAQLLLRQSVRAQKGDDCPRRFRSALGQPDPH